MLSNKDNFDMSGVYVEGVIVLLRLTIRSFHYGYFAIVRIGYYHIGDANKMVVQL